MKSMQLELKDLIDNCDANEELKKTMKENIDLGLENAKLIHLNSQLTKELRELKNANK